VPPSRLNVTRGSHIGLEPVLLPFQNSSVHPVVGNRSRVNVGTSCPLDEGVCIRFQDTEETDKNRSGGTDQTVIYLDSIVGEYIAKLKSVVISDEFIPSLNISFAASAQTSAPKGDELESPPHAPSPEDYLSKFDKDLTVRPRYTGLRYTGYLAVPDDTRSRTPKSTPL